LVKTYSTMLELGTAAPDFSLINTDSQIVTLADFANSRALLVMFICNHCPYVKHVARAVAQLADDYVPKNVGVVAIMSNDVAHYPEDSLDKMKLEKQSQGYHFPYLLDQDQLVAKAYHAACTPDFFVFDANCKLTYRGQLCDSRPSSNLPVTGTDLRAALDATLAGEPPVGDQKPSLGCNIKWIAGQEPSYFL